MGLWKILMVVKLCAIVSSVVTSQLHLLSIPPTMMLPAKRSAIEAKMLATDSTASPCTKHASKQADNFLPNKRPTCLCLHPTVLRFPAKALPSLLQLLTLIRMVFGSTVSKLFQATKKLNWSCLHTAFTINMKSQSSTHWYPVTPI